MITVDMPAVTTQVLRVGHSPDPDDAFMFYAMTRGRLPLPGFQIEHLLEDIESLNQRACQGELEVTAFSFHCYAYCAQHYRLLTAGASMGDGYGPIVVARQPMVAGTFLKVDARHHVRNQGQSPPRTVPTIAIPGRLTTAALVLGLYAGQVKTVVMPFDQILPAVQRGDVAAGILIHEGQLTYEGYGLHKVVDLGAWWRTETGLPLPLGVNGVRRDLPQGLQRAVARLMRRSITYALAHRDEALTYAQQYGRGLDRPRTDRFVGMYVNHWTEDCGLKGRQAMTLLLERAHQAGLIRQRCVPEFVS